MIADTYLETGHLYECGIITVRYNRKSGLIFMITEPYLESYYYKKR